MSKLGGNIRGLRDEKGLTQMQLGEKIGVAESTISLYENGKREPDNATLARLADFFCVTTDYLLGRTNKNSDTIRNKTISLFDKIALSPEQAAAAEKIRNMPPNEQQASFQKALDKLKSLSADNQEALIKIINSLPSSRE